MKKNDWMSTFYGRDWFEVEAGETPREQPVNTMLEWRTPSSEVAAWLRAQQLGFTLVETVVEFETRVAPADGVRPSIRAAVESDLDAILAMTREGFVDNTAFQNRFKNRQFFSAEQCWAYYRAAVTNAFNDNSAVTVVFEQNGVPLAYYMARQIEEDVYKGAMTAVREAARGQRIHAEMQQASFNLVGREITIVNSTQLGNRPALASHIRNGRRMSRIDHVFYRLR